MRGRSWHDVPQCPRLDELSVVHLTHVGFDDRDHPGVVVVARELAPEVELIFRRLYACRFPLARVAPVAEFDGDDALSMAANNSSAFNYRVVAGTARLSMHALGRAIDLNPVQNPMIVDGEVIPNSGVAFTDRHDLRPGMIVRPGPCVEIFDELGWEWGGDWSSFKDYHHFVKPV